jgi:hypothetical protein
MDRVWMSEPQVGKAFHGVSCEITYMRHFLSYENGAHLCIIINDDGHV